MYLLPSRTTAPADDEYAHPHNRLLAAIGQALGLIHGEVRDLRATLTENGERLHGARYLPLPANVPTTGRLALISSGVEVLGWVLTETSGAGVGKIILEDGDVTGTDDGSSIPISVPANTTNPARWSQGVSFARGLAVRFPAGAPGTVAGVVLIR